MNRRKSNFQPNEETNLNEFGNRTNIERDKNLDFETESNDFEIPISSTDFEQRAEILSDENSEISNFKYEVQTDSKDQSQIANRQSQIQIPPFNSAAKVVKTADISDVSASKIRPVAQLHDSFIIAVDDEGMLLIDQHVAHERILFDKFQKKETERKIESQNLLLPETIDLTPAQSLKRFRSRR